MPTPQWREETVTVAGTPVHCYRGGEGPPLLLLHGSEGNPGWLLHHQTLAQHFSVYAPSHPGFGMTPRPEWIATIADMAVFYLWWLDTLQLERVHMLGHSIGGWLAADMATLCPQRLNRLVLVDAAGIKPQQHDILDIFLMTPPQVRNASFFDPKQVPEWSQLYERPTTPEDLERSEAALEMLVRLCWKPFMHEPRLLYLLPRIAQPTLIVWGREDAIMPLECGELYRQNLANAQLAVLDACGHCPHLERPQVFADAVLSFLR